MLEQSVKLVDELLSCEDVTQFTTTGLSESEANEYISLPKKYDVVFTKTVNSGYSVLVEPKITPKNVVRDFGVEKVIDKLLPILVTDINDYPDEQRIDSAIWLAYWIISNESGELSNFGKEKYSKIMDSEFIPERLSRYVLEYVVDEANKAKLPISLTIKDVDAYWKAGVQHA